MPDLGEKDSKPSWVPLKKNPEFACSVMSGIDSSINSVNEEKFIPNQEIFSIRYIRLFKWEIGLYFIVSILAFGLWFVLGGIFLLYTLAQIYFNYRVMLLTSKGQIPLKFETFNEKDDFIYTLKKTNPSIFSKKRWFQFKR